MAWRRMKGRSLLLWPSAGAGVAMRRQRGGSSTEYMLVLALVVLPIAMLTPMILGMIVNYSQRIWVIFRFPLG